MNLTQKEFNVAYLYSQGRCMKQAAHQNKLTYHSARHYLKRVYKKLGINNSFDLHRWFMEQGI